MTRNSPPQYGQASFTEPASSGYLYLGMRVAPPARFPIVRRSARRDEEIDRCDALARELETLQEVLAATVYQAVLIPPVQNSPRFDVLVLIQTTSPEVIPTVQETTAYQQLEADFVMPARNIRRIGDIDNPRSGSFLFNHFWATDPALALPTFDNITGWFTDRAGIKDSALLEPIDETSYVFVNHVRLSTTPIRFMLQLAKPSFRKYVAANLHANKIGNAPLLCRTV